MYAPPCGTREAEQLHRREGEWPCRACLAAQAGLAITQMCQQIRCPDNFTDADRYELARAVHDMAPPVGKFGFILGLPVDVAQRLYVALNGDRPHRNDPGPGI
jgi:hypothetical protein